MRERACKDDRVARYYGELIGPQEAARRVAAGTRYIVQANARHFLDAEAVKNQRGCYANDNGPKNNAHIATKINTCPDTGMSWVSVTSTRKLRIVQIFFP